MTERAAQLGIGRTLLQRWLAELSRAGAAAFPGSGPAQDELARLRRRLAAVTQERDILKDAIRFFAREPQP